MELPVQAVAGAGDGGGVGWFGTGSASNEDITSHHFRRRCKVCTTSAAHATLHGSDHPRSHGTQFPEKSVIF